MQAGDVVPSRLAAAQDAATAFVKQLPPGINLGLETFAGTAAILVSPLVDRTPAINEIQHLKLSESTATGDAINAAVSAIQTFEQSIPGGTVAAPPAKIVLMSDGKQTIDGDEFDAAQHAGAAKIPISTISFGTPDGLIMLNGQQVPVPVDDDALSQVARLSGGSFFAARSNAEIHQVYDTLGSQLGYQTHRVDAAKPWFILATLASLIAAAVTIGLGQRLPA
jgi:Ca-activated chloride channel family protein